MLPQDNTTYGTNIIATIKYETEFVGGDTYMVTKTTVEKFPIKITK